MSGHYPYDSDAEQDNENASFSRRDILKGAAALVGGGAAIAGGSPAFAQAPAVVTGWKQATLGRRFAALTRFGTKCEVAELTMQQLHPRQLVVRTQASQACYTLVNVLDSPNLMPARNANIFGHGCVGIVEEVGPQVRRVVPGDRVIITQTSQCGECYNCLRQRVSHCHAAFGRPNNPIATMKDGTPVLWSLSGFSELTVAWDEHVVPIKSNHDAAELSNISCVGVCGLGMAMVGPYAVDPGSTVVVFGLGPVGMAAVQGARIQGATTIVAVDPVKYRRDIAAKVGATATLDPNSLPNEAAIIEALKAMTKDPFEGRPFAGGIGSRGTVGPLENGPDYVLESVGNERYAPKVERYREPQGLEVLHTVHALCPPGGVMKTSSGGQPGNFTVGAQDWSNSAKIHIPGNMAGVQMKRDLPRWTRLMEKGIINGEAMVGVKAPLDRWRDAVEAAAHRTAITGIVTFPT
jgi:S-(hydroxymethyl)glutathione dehydrogenase/alcohol dehydrogenase